MEEIKRSAVFIILCDIAMAIYAVVLFFVPPSSLRLSIVSLDYYTIAEKIQFLNALHLGAKISCAISIIIATCYTVYFFIKRRKYSERINYIIEKGFLCILVLSMVNYGLFSLLIR